MSLEELIVLAKKARDFAYAPYSRFGVGAVLVARDGRTFLGCNVENISFGLTICAERAAVCAAVASGCRDFTQIVIVADTNEAISPCGACRQVLAEFAPDLLVTTVNLQGGRFQSSLAALLPRATTGILDTS